MIFAGSMRDARRAGIHVAIETKSIAMVAPQR